MRHKAGVFFIALFMMLAFLSFQSNSGLAQDDSALPPIALTATAQVPTPQLSRDLSDEAKIALGYMGEKYELSSDQLIMVNEHNREYVELGRTFRLFSFLQPESKQHFKLMVDLQERTVVEDVEAMEQAESKAKFAKYGKFEPALFDKLETMLPTDKATVAIWVVGEPLRSQEEVFAALAAKYPEAQAALDRYGDPFSVDDEELINEIENEYTRLLHEGMTDSLQPLVRHLQELGYAVTTLDATPAFIVTLPKAELQATARMPQVGHIYLAEEEAKPTTDSAVPSDRVPAVWERGFEGNGIEIGIVESGRVDFDGPAPGGHNYLNQGNIRACGEGLNDHKTRVASVAASFHSVYKGVAPEATIYDACQDGSQGDAVDALAWATGRADPINASIAFESDNQLHFTDRAFDHWARYGIDTIVKSAGNIRNGEEDVTSPGKGWNVITVGSTNHEGTSDWSDDTWRSSSRWRNPNSNLEKPEVVAPGDSITAIGIDGQEIPSNGTSFAAPQVTGLAALLMDRHSNLVSAPTALKAIIMASAVHNIDGPSGIPPGKDLKDGAGAIDAALADMTAKTKGSSSPCTAPCWWKENIDPNDFDNGYIWRHFQASRGERVRVAISWWSNADCPDEANCSYDRLDTDLDLVIYPPSGLPEPWLYSSSYYNNYEFVEFTASQTGEYAIGVYNYRFDEPNNDIGIAWVKDATYLPDLRNKDGWVSKFYVRNDGAQRRHVTINYFDTDGNPTPQESDVCGLDPNEWCWIPVNDFDRIPSGTTGSAILDGGEDVSVIVVTDNDSAGKTYSYEGIPSTGERSQIGPGDELFIPSYRRGLYGYDSWLTVQNVNTESTNTTFTFYNDAGNQVESTSYNISAGGQRTVSLSGASQGSVRVTTSNKPVSVIVLHDHAGQAMGYSGLTRGATEGYFPSLFRDYYALLSSYQIQEVTNQSVSGDAHYSNGTSTSFSLSSRGHRQVGMRSEPLPNGWLGAAEFNRTGGSGEMTTATHHSYTRTGAAIGYTGFQNGARDLLIPYLSNADGWRTGIAVQNIGKDSTTVEVKLYNGDGSPGPTIASFTLNPGQRYSVFNQIPLNFSGSAQLHSTSSEIAAVVHASTNNRAYGYRALVR